MKKMNKLLIAFFTINSFFTVSAMKVDKDDLGQKLIKAARMKNCEKVQQFIKEGADINAKNNHGNTALMWAAENDHTDALKLLIEHGAEINAKNNIGITALMKAAFNGHTDTLKLLIEHGAEINAKNNDNLTAIMRAAYNDHTDALKLLIKHGAEINATDNDGETALMKAAYNGHTDALKLLIENGAEINATDNDGWTAIMRATQRNKQPCCELLVEAMIAQEKAPFCFLFCHKKAWENNSDLQILPKDIAQLIAKQCRNETIKTQDEINKIRNTETKQNLLEKYFIEPLILQESIYTFLNCLRLNDCENIKNTYTRCIIDSLKPYLRQMIDKSKEDVLIEINKITDNEINQNLLDKYFPEEKN